MRTFRQAIRTEDFVITAEPALTPATTVEAVRACVAGLRPAVAAIQIGDNRTARAHMAPLAVASIARQDGVDAVVHISCRDRNRIALQSELLGAAGLGVSSLLITRGDPLPDHARIQTKAVFEFGAKRLIGMAQLIGADPKLVAPPGFLLGAALTVFEPPDDWEPEGLKNKADAGSKFLQTQPCLDMALLQRYMAAVVGSRMLARISVIVEVPLFESAEAIDALQFRSPNMLVPESVRERIGQAGDARQEGIDICATAIGKISTIAGVSGVNIVFDNDADAVVEAIRLAGVSDFD